jgi:hypothetical protein
MNAGSGIRDLYFGIELGDLNVGMKHFHLEAKA